MNGFLENWTFQILCLILPLVESKVCRDKMLWDKKTYLSASLGYDLQLCCNVTKVWAAKVEKGWQLAHPPALDTKLDNISLPGSEFILSACTDGTVSQGIVVAQHKNVTCKPERGRVARILPSVNGFHINKWYVLCYTVRETTNSECRSCSFERLCANRYHPNCTSIWLDRATVNVSNESLTVIMRVGKELPFLGDLNILVQDHNQQVVFSKTAHSIAAGSNHTFLVEGLMPDSWYRVTTCLHSDIPQSFLDRWGFGMNRKMRECLDAESHKTQSSTSSASQSLPPLLPSFLIITSLLLLHFLGANHESTL